MTLDSIGASAAAAVFASATMEYGFRSEPVTELEKLRSEIYSGQESRLEPGLGKEPERTPVLAVAQLTRFGAELGANTSDAGRRAREKRYAACL